MKKRYSLLIASSVALLGALGLYVLVAKRTPGVIQDGPNNPVNGVNQVSFPVPPALIAARAMLSQTLAIKDQASIELIEMKRQEWLNSCLGLARPDEFCSQMIVPGYRITLRVSGVVYYYRTNSDGSLI